MNAPVQPPRRELFSARDPYTTQMLPVSAVHTLHVEESGLPNGIPVLALHGGPGGGLSPEMRRFFDPQRFRTILFDQRGCGKSTPHASLEDNTTWRLVEDIEKIRAVLGLDRWIVFGGSWGSTLALAYAIAHPERVAGLVLRGVFLLTKREIRWFYQDGASHIFPDAFERYLSPIPPNERGDLIKAFYKRLTARDAGVRLAAARAWSRWEGETISFAGPAALPARFNDDRFVDAFARIECHYFIHDGFFASDGWLLHHARALARIPIRIVHGRYDMCTPLSSAWALKQVCPHAHLDIIADAGHSSLEPGIVDGLLRAADWMADGARW